MIFKLLLCVIIQIWSAEANATIPVTESSPKLESTSTSPEIDSVQKIPSVPGVMGAPSFFKVENMHTTIVHGMPCVCNVGFKSTTFRDDYHYTAGVGAHKLHTRAVTWNEARKMCIDEGGHLAIINSNLEAHVLMELFNKSEQIKGATYDNVAFLGIHDLYKEGEWVTVQGDSLFKSGYTRWSNQWGGQPDNGGGKQNCGVFMKDGTLDDVFCDVPFAFFCEISSLHFLH